MGLYYYLKAKRAGKIVLAVIGGIVTAIILL